MVQVEVESICEKYSGFLNSFNPEVKRLFTKKILQEKHFVMRHKGKERGSGHAFLGGPC